MGRCVHCQRVKGRRSCPVLGGMICSLCCGQHRLKTIACPSDCQYLGGLALVDEAQPISDFPRGALDEVVQGMAVYSRSGAEHRAAREAIARFFGEDGDPHDADEWAQGLCLGYLYYGHRDCSGRRLVDRFAEQRGRDLGREAALAVRSLKSCWASLFEVEAVYRGAGIDLRDMLSEEAIKVSEVSGTYQIRSGETLFAWLMPVGDRIEMVGVSAIVHMEARARLLGELRATRAGPRDRGGDAPLVYRLLSDAIAHAPLPKLANTDGEDLVLCKAHYEVLDAGAAREALGVVPGFEADGDSFHWIGPSKMRGPDATVSLGRVDLDGAALVLETNSRERLERGKRLLGEHAGRWIEHRADSIQSTESLLREAPRAPRDRPPRDEVPPEVQAEVVGQFLRDHYATWPDVPLPALGGKTPRQAAQTKRGRAKVRALVDL